MDLPEVGAFPFDGAAFDLGGVVDAYGVSGNLDFILDADQEDSFRFLGLSFTAVSETVSSSILVDLTDPFLLMLDSSFGDLSVDYSLSQVDINVSSATSVPAPGAFMLLAAGLPALILARRRLSSNKG